MQKTYYIQNKFPKEGKSGKIFLTDTKDCYKDRFMKTILDWNKNKHIGQWNIVSVQK